MNIFKKAFWVYAGDRAIKTVAQTAIALLSVGSISGILDVAWIPLASAVGLAGVLSLLTSVIAFNGTSTDNPVVNGGAS